MTTNVTIIGDALREINVINEVQSPSSEQGSQALRKLNQMMELWKEDGVDIGWFRQSSTTDTAPIPEWAEMPVTMGLCVVLAPQYGRSISAETAAKVNASMNTMKRKLIKEQMDNADMSHMPSGSKNGAWDINTDT